MKKNIYLIRHTTPEVEQGICYGQTDLALSKSFHEELHTLYSKVPDNLDYIISSPAQRCFQLAQNLQTTKLEKDNRLWEMHFGDWEMKRWNDINKDELQKWMDDFTRIKIPNGESFQEVYERVVQVWQEIIQLEYEQIGIVAHSGSIRAILAFVMGFPLEKAFIPAIDYGKTCLVEVNKGFYKLKYMNY